MFREGRPVPRRPGDPVPVPDVSGIPEWVAGAQVPSGRVLPREVGQLAGPVCEPRLTLGRALRRVTVLSGLTVAGWLMAGAAVSYAAPAAGVSIGAGSVSSHPARERDTPPSGVTVPPPPRTQDTRTVTRTVTPGTTVDSPDRTIPADRPGRAARPGRTPLRPAACPELTAVGSGVPPAQSRSAEPFPGGSSVPPRRGRVVRADIGAGDFTAPANAGNAADTGDAGDAGDIAEPVGPGESSTQNCASGLAVAMPPLVDGDPPTVTPASEDPQAPHALPSPQFTPDGRAPSAVSAPRPRSPRETHPPSRRRAVGGRGVVLSAATPVDDSTATAAMRDVHPRKVRADHAGESAHRRPRDATPTYPAHPRPDPPPSDGPPPVERPGLNQPPNLGEPAAFPGGGVTPHPVSRVAREPMSRIRVCNDAGEPTTSPD